MAEAEKILAATDTVLVVDWPTRDVPDSLVLAGYTVVVKGGPGPGDYSAYEIEEGQVVVRPAGAAPGQADLVYSYRPMEELAGIVSQARAIGAKAIWSQSGLTSDGAKDPKGCWVAEDELRRAQKVVQEAGMAFIEQPYIADYVGKHPRRRT